MSDLVIKSREEWLQAAVDDLRPVFRGQNLIVPERLHVSVGWPASGGLGKSRRVYGQCWGPITSADQTPHIFISPLLDKLIVPGSFGILGVLVHEVVHAAVGVEAKHGPRFAKACKLLGFEGKPTSNYPGPILEARLAELAERLGAFPHAAIKPEEKAAKKQTTRMRKAQCETCGYIIRTTKQWLEKYGPPICPCNKDVMLAELPPAEDGDDDSGED